jgi:hypothetical protein
MPSNGLALSAKKPSLVILRPSSRHLIVTELSHDRNLQHMYAAEYNNTTVLYVSGDVSQEHWYHPRLHFIDQSLIELHAWAVLM